MDEILAKRIYNYIDENPKPILDEIIQHINNILPMLEVDEKRDVQVEICVGQMIDQHIIYAHLGQYYTKEQYFDAVKHNIIPIAKEAYVGKHLQFKKMVSSSRWVARRACYDIPVERFFSHKKTEQQKIIAQCCNICPVKEECLQYAREGGLEGIFGGKIFKRKGDDVE